MPQDPEQPGDHERDGQLVRAVLGGDAVARRDFAERMKCVARFLAAANRRSGNPLGSEEMLDLVQDTLVRIWGKLTTFEGRSTLETWAYGYCHFEFLNRVRRRDAQRHRTASGDAGALESAVDDSPPQPELGYESLEQGLSRLDPSEEDVIRLKHFESLTFDEVGARLEVPANTARTRYYRGIARLRSFLERRREGPA